MDNGALAEKKAPKLWHEGKEKERQGNLLKNLSRELMNLAETIQKESVKKLEEAASLYEEIDHPTMSNKLQVLALEPKNTLLQPLKNGNNKI